MLFRSKFGFNENIKKLVTKISEYDVIILGVPEHNGNVPAYFKNIFDWCTKSSKAKTNRVLPKEHTRHSKHDLPTTHETILHMDITRWPSLKSD